MTSKEAIAKRLEEIANDGDNDPETWRKEEEGFQENIRHGGKHVYI